VNQALFLHWSLVRRLLNQLQIQLQIQIQRPFRRQLRWLMRVTFFGCKKSNQKCALQAAAVGSAGRRGLGVWCQVWGFDCGSSCPCGVFFFGSRVKNGFRLQWLSERGCRDRAGTVRLGMLKRVSVPVRLGRSGPGFGLASCPVAGVARFFTGFSRDGVPAPIAPAHRRRMRLPQQIIWTKSGGGRRLEGQSPSGRRPRSRPQTGTFFSIHRSTQRDAIAMNPLR